MVSTTAALLRRVRRRRELGAALIAIALNANLNALAYVHRSPRPPPLEFAHAACDGRLFLLAAAAHADAFTVDDGSNRLDSPVDVCAAISRKSAHP